MFIVPPEMRPTTAPVEYFRGRLFPARGRTGTRQSRSVDNAEHVATLLTVGVEALEIPDSCHAGPAVLTRTVLRRR
jgi:hypothetical protein